MTAERARRPAHRVRESRGGRLVLNETPVDDDAIVFGAGKIEHHHRDLAQRSRLDCLYHLRIEKRLGDALALKMGFLLIDAGRDVGRDDERDIDGLACLARHGKGPRRRSLRG